MSFCLIILAAGNSSRFRSNVGKPYQRIGGKSLIEINLIKAQKFKQIKKIILVYNKKDLKLIKLLNLKNVKLEKMKKRASICKLHTILEVAPSKKIRCLCEKTLSIQARFSVKNRAKIGPESDSKWQRQEKPTKIASGAVSGRTFSFQEPFLMDFGLPAGTRKSPKNRPWPQSPVYFLCLQLVFLRFLRSGAFRKRPGPIPEAPGDPP